MARLATIETTRRLWSGRQILLLAGVLLIAANLRPGITSVSPLLVLIGTSLGLGSFGLIALATIPVICFAALAPVSLPLQRRFGLESVVLGVLALLFVGLALRLIDSASALYSGTILAAGAIAVGNVLIPAIVKRDFPGRVGLVTGLYVTILYVTAATGAGVSVPLAHATELSWRFALGFWAIPALVALVVWLPQLAHGATRVPLQHWSGGFARMARSPLAWAVTLFMGFQSLGYYALLSWLPALLHSVGVTPATAGLMLSVSTIVALPSTLVTPSLAARSRDQRGLTIAILSVTLVGYLGLMLAPGAAPWLWVVIMGVGQGAMFPLALTFVVLRAGGATEAMALSAFSQTIGYAVSIAGPLGMGALHALTGQWWVAMAFETATLIPTLWFGLRASRPETINL
ncbi:CynX/NimT family MFS transporter [Acidiphilium sp.]|uniref:CynX/NimT family MFS transporter n=1 Tax=Acidiphilium sp. TaxID=527 RepID=UPI003D027C00